MELYMSVDGTDCVGMRVRSELDGKFLQLDVQLLAQRLDERKSSRLVLDAECMKMNMNKMPERSIRRGRRQP